MYPTDPVSVQHLRSPQLLEAEQRRMSLRADIRSAFGTASVVSRILRVASRPSELDGSLEPFVGLDQRALHRLARHFSIVDVADGAALARQGDPATDFVVVLAGRIGVSIDGFPIAVLDAGSQFGALPMLDGAPGRFSRASYNVLEPSRIAVADRHHFFEILKNFPVVGQRILQIAEIRRAYLQGHADGRALEADRETAPFPVHLVDRV
jgi:CRP-like cAMP-binding protein